MNDVDYNWAMRWKIGLVLGFVVLLIIILVGWQLAPRIEGLEPSEGELHGREPLMISFTRPMDRESVENQISLVPSQPSVYSWNEDNTRLILTPNKSWPAGEIITANQKQGILVGTGEEHRRSRQRHTGIASTAPNDQPLASTPVTDWHEQARRLVPGDRRARCAPS